MKTLINISLVLILFVSCTQNSKKNSENQTKNKSSNELREVVEEKIEVTPTEESETTELVETNENEAVVKEEIAKEEVAKEKTPIKKEIKKEISEEKKEKKEEIKKVVEKVFNHQLFHTLLKKYVSSKGIVNYKGLKSNEKELDAYIELLQNNPIESNWNRNKKLAFWINAYNAFTIKLILSNYPLSSITNLEGGKPWDKKWISLNGQTYSLNDIENSIIRPQFKDARIHFAVNCAAKSCPKLGNFAYEEKTLNALLERQTKSFINSKGNTITSSKIEVSKIFEWYAEDFGELITFLNKYSEIEISKDAMVEFIEYDWSLNE